MTNNMANNITKDTTKAMTKGMANHTTKEYIKNSADGAIEKAKLVAVGGCGQVSTDSSYTTMHSFICQ